MALATQCPHCKTTFRVAQDQLKLRAGLVRCGACKEIFNGIEHLLPSDVPPAAPAPAPKAAEPAAKIAPPPPPSPAQERVSEPAPADESGSSGIPISILISTPAPISAALDFAYPEPHPEPAEPEPEPEASKTETAEFVDFVDVLRQVNEAQAEAENEIESPPEDPLQRMTLVDFTDTLPGEPYLGEIGEAAVAPVATPDAEIPDPLDQVIDELKRKPLRGTKKRKPYARRPEPVIGEEASQSVPPETDEPEFVKQGRRKQTIGRTMRIAMGLGSFILLLTVLAQASLAFRDQLAARVPETKPILLTACAWLDCKIGLPAQIESMSIESDTLETLNNKKDASELTMLLRNSSTTVQAWPHLELTLNDANSTMLARRVFAPHDYLAAAQDEKKGVASNTEQTVKLYIEFSGAKPAGYHVGIFYP